MDGRIWIGRASMPAGRAGEAPSVGLTEALVALGFETDRLKTGTPARVDRRTVDFSNLEEQPGEWLFCCGFGWFFLSTDHRRRRLTTPRPHTPNKTKNTLRRPGGALVQL